jgi:glycosyltransferase involved in cell wall biosynthesis
LNYFVKEPSVDIVIINWNYGRFVGDAIQSVKDQSYQKYRCIVVDNGSDDDSAERIVEAIRGHAQFELLRLPSNLGQLGAGLWALERCAGEFITFLDADDILFPAHLESHVQVHLAAAAPVGFTCSACVDTNAIGVLLTGGNYNMHQHWQSHGEPVLRPIERTMRLPGVDERSYAALAGASRYLPARCGHWCWCPGSSNMLRRVLLDRIRPSGSSSSLFGGVDSFYLPIIHALTGSILIDQQLSAYRVHSANDHSALPGLRNVWHMHSKGEALSLASYSRMLCWIIDHVDDVVLMTKHRYWQVFNTAVSTDWRVREALLQPEFRATLARRYLRLVELFGESQVFRELRKLLLFSEYLNIIRAADQRGFPLAAFSRSLTRESARKASVLAKWFRSFLGST